MFQSQAIEFITGASLSEICFALLMGSTQNLNGPTTGKQKKQEEDVGVWSPSNVTLSGMDPKLGQLQQVAQQLISHVDVVASADWMQR